MLLKLVVNTIALSLEPDRDSLTGVEGSGSKGEVTASNSITAEVVPNGIGGGPNGRDGRDVHRAHGAGSSITEDKPTGT